MNVRSGLNYKSFSSVYVKEAYCAVDNDSSASEGDLKPGGPFGAYR